MTDAWLTDRRSAPIRWSMLNSNAELIASNLLAVTGDFTFKPFQEYTGFTPQNSDGVFPLNVYLHYQTLGAKMPLQAQLEGEVQYCLRTLYDGDKLDRGYIHYDVDLYQSYAPEELVGRNTVIMALTRPFGPPEKRKVRRLPEVFAKLPEENIPADYIALQGTEYLCGRTFSRPLVSTATVEQPIFMNLTDLYQHVYTVSYYRIAEMIIANAMADAQANIAGIDFGQANMRDVRSIFRKPFTAGQTAVIELQFHSDEEGFETLLVFRHKGDAPDKPPSVVIAIDGSYQ